MGRFSSLSEYPAKSSSVGERRDVVEEEVLHVLISVVGDEMCDEFS